MSLLCCWHAHFFLSTGCDTNSKSKCNLVTGSDSFIEDTKLWSNTYLFLLSFRTGDSKPVPDYDFMVYPFALNSLFFVFVQFLMGLPRLCFWTLWQLWPLVIDHDIKLSPREYSFHLYNFPLLAFSQMKLTIIRTGGWGYVIKSDGKVGETLTELFKLSK